MDKVYVEVKVKLIIRTEPGVDIGNVIDEMDYSFESTTEDANIEDTEILDYEITYAK